MLRQLMHDLCDDLGIDTLAPDARGVYEIVFDGGLPVEILPLSASQVLVRSEIAQLPDDENEWKGELERHLKFNLLLLRDQANTLSLERETGKIWLYRLARGDHISRQEFCELLSAFTVTLEWWKSRGGTSTVTTSAMDLMPHNVIRP